MVCVYVGKAKLVGVAVILVVDDIAACITADEIEVRASAAADGLVACSEMEEIDAAGTLDR